MYIENPTDSTKKLLEPIHEFSKVAGYKNKYPGISSILIFFFFTVRYLWILLSQLFLSVLYGLCLGVVLHTGRIFSTLHIFHGVEGVSTGVTHLASLWTYTYLSGRFGRRNSPFILLLESVPFLQTAHILWSLSSRVVLQREGLHMVISARNWESQFLGYSISRSIVIVDLSYVSDICFIVENIHCLSDLWVYLSIGYKLRKQKKGCFYSSHLYLKSPFSL